MLIAGAIYFVAITLGNLGKFGEIRKREMNFGKLEGELEAI
jgi:hypothetical protein